MDNFICIFTMVCCFTLSSSLPVDNSCPGLLYGIPVEEGLEVNPDYPHPEYILPLIVEGGDNTLSNNLPDPEGCNRAKHLGYANVNALRSMLMPLDQFMAKHCLPENVRFKVIKDARPVLDLQQCDSNVNTIVV